MRALTSRAASAERWARARTSEATTAEAAAGIARARRLDACVEGEEVGLEGDAVDDGDDVRDFLGRALDALHGVDRAAHHGAGLLGLAAGDGHRLVGAARVVGRLADRGADLAHRRRGLLQAGGLMLGAVRQVVGGLTDLGGAGVDAAGGLGHQAQRRLERSHGFVEVGLQLGEGAVQIGVDAGEQIALGKARQAIADAADDQLHLLGLGLLGCRELIAEGADRADQLGDLVLTAHVGQRHVVAALGQRAHRVGQLADRTGDGAHQRGEHGAHGTQRDRQADQRQDPADRIGAGGGARLAADRLEIAIHHRLDHRGERVERVLRAHQVVGRFHVEVAAGLVEQRIALAHIGDQLGAIIGERGALRVVVAMRGEEGQRLVDAAAEAVQLLVVSRDVVRQRGQDVRRFGRTIEA